MKRKSFLTTLGNVALLFVVFFGLMGLMNMRQAGGRIVNNYVTSDVVYADGSTAHFANKNFGRLDEGDVATLHIYLPKRPIYQNAELLFYNYNAVTEVWFCDTLLESYGADIAADGMMVGNRYFFITVPDGAWGNEITVTVRATTDNAFSNFTNLRIYPSESAYEYFIDVDPLGFICSIAMIVLGLLGLCACVLGSVRGRALSNALFLIGTMMLASLWLIANEGIYTFFGFYDYFWQPLEYIAGYTMAIPLLLFYRGMTDAKSKWRKIFGIAAAVITAFFGAATVLNFTNVLHYDSLMEPASMLIMGTGVLLLIYTVQMKTGGNRARSLMKMGMFVLLPCCLYEVYVRALFKLLPLASIYNYHPSMALGILLFILCQLCAYFSDLYEKQKDLIRVQIEADNLNRTIEAIPTGICQVMPDDDLAIIAANDIFYKLIGYRQEELVDKSGKDLLANMYDGEKVIIRERVQEIISNADNTGEFELSTVKIDGQPLTVLIRYFYDRDGSGNITANVIDITDRKRMEEELRVSKERYKLALSQSGKVFFFFDVPARTMRLSQELANLFGLPVEVDNVPENPVSCEFVEPESVKTYRQFYEEIIAGEKHGDAIIACHMRNTPELAVWYQIAFTTIYDDSGLPSSSIITYENIDDQHRAELASRWKQLNLISVPESRYVIAVYDLTQDRILSQTGSMFKRMPDSMTGFDEINAFVLERYFHANDREGCRRFLDRQRLIDMFHTGNMDDYIEYRSLQGGLEYRWTSMAVSMVEDSYNGHVMAQLLFMDIHDSKSGAIKMKQNMAELQKELENSRIKVMMNQMRPHFLYNALSAIQTIVKVDPDYAYQLIYDFTVHLRSSIKALSSDTPILFSDELSNIKAYLNIEKMRFGDRMNVVYEIETDDFAVIPLSIQPLAENAARHGLYPKGEEGGTIWIRSRETEDAFIVEVEDDGEGFDVDEVMNRDSDSIGMKNLIFRLKSLMDADVDIRSQTGKGTLARVTIPKDQGRVNTNEDDNCRR